MKKKDDTAENETPLQEEQDVRQREETLQEDTSRQEDALKETSLDDVAKRYVDDDEFGEISLKSFLGGDLLGSRFFRRQVIFILFVAMLMLLYTGNRYSAQQEIITIDSLKVQLQKERYNVLTQSSELLNLSRQSNIERALRANGDSAIMNPTTPPYEIFADE